MKHLCDVEEPVSVKSQILQIGDYLMVDQLSLFHRFNRYHSVSVVPEGQLTKQNFSRTDIELPLSINPPIHDVIFSTHTDILS